MAQISVTIPSVAVSRVVDAVRASIGQPDPFETDADLVRRFIIKRLKEVTRLHEASAHGVSFSFDDFNITKGA